MNLSHLKPNPKNPRKISEEKLKLLKKSLEHFGDLSGFVFNRRTQQLVGGHQRAKVLPQNAEIHIITHYDTPTTSGTTAEGYVIVNHEKYAYREVEWDEPTVKAANIAANKHGGEWDLPILSEWLLDLDHLNFDLDLTGFDTRELENLLAPLNKNSGNCDEDSVPSTPEQSKTKSGDLFILGEHRLLCGDSINEKDLNQLVGDKSIDLVFTDPPYNVNYDPEARDSSFSQERLKNPLGKIQNDKKTPEEFRGFLDQVYQNLNRVLKPGGAVYICHADTEGHHFRNTFIAQSWNLQSCLIWKKTTLVFGRADYHWMHEPILYGWKTGAAHFWYGDRKQTTILEFPTDHQNKQQCDTDGYVHPTQKPVALIECAIKNSSLTDQNVLDLFGGSGSTLIACEKNNRHCFMMELDPHYCDVIIERWKKFTGKEVYLCRDTGEKLPWSEL